MDWIMDLWANDFSLGFINEKYFAIKSLLDQ